MIVCWPQRASLSRALALVSTRATTTRDNRDVSTRLMLASAENRQLKTNNQQLAKTAPIAEAARISAKMRCLPRVWRRSRKEYCAPHERSPGMKVMSMEAAAVDKL